MARVYVGQRWFVLALALSAGALAGEEQRVSFEWRANGTLVVDERLVLEAASGKLVPLPEAALFPDGHAVLAPTAARAAGVRDGVVVVREVGRPERRFKPPRLRPPFADARASEGEVAWASDDLLGYSVYVTGDISNAEQVTLCATLRLRRGTWERRGPGCELSHGPDVGPTTTRGPRGWRDEMWVGEGSVMSWTVTRDGRHVLSIHAGNPAWLAGGLSYSADGRTARLLTDCSPTLPATGEPLSLELACDYDTLSEDEPPVTLLAWDGTAAPPRLVRSGLPPRAGLSPDGERFAWPLPGRRVCVGDPAGAFTCVAVPPPEKATER